MGNNNGSSAQKTSDENSRSSLGASNRSSFYLNVNKTLSKVSSSSVELVVSELRMHCELGSDEHNESRLKYLAEELLESAVRNQEVCVKYMKIAQKMFDVTVKCGSASVCFKDIYLTLAMNKINSFSVSGDYPHENSKKDTATFIVQLYVLDIASSSLMYHWIQKFNCSRDIQEMIFAQIRNKVFHELRPKSNNEEKNDLYSLLFPSNVTEEGTNKINQDAVGRHSHLDSDDDSEDDMAENFPSFPQASTSSKVPTPATQTKPIASSITNPLSASSIQTKNVLETNKSHVQLNPSNNNPKTPPVAQNSNKTHTMELSFRNYLLHANASPQSNFDFNQFKTSSDHGRAACAKVMLALVLSAPENIVHYANTTRIILCQYSLSHKVQKTFGNHLNELINARLEVLFSRPVSQDWDWKKAIGVFIGQLYVRESVKKDNMLKWLKFVQIMVNKNDPASIQTLFSVLEIIMNSLKVKDRNTYKMYLMIIKELSDLKRVPSRHAQWTKQLLSVKASGNFWNASSVSSLNSSETISTKDTPRVLQPNLTTQICSSFQKFLNALQNGQQATHSYLNFHLYEEPALKGCALILIEHASLYPANARIYAALTANTLVGQMSGDKKKQFINFMTQFFQAEINKCFKRDSPDKSNWSRILNVGSFLSELYNFQVVDVKLVGSWIEPIFEAGLIGNESALEALLSVQKRTESKMKDRDIIFFNVIMDYAEKMLKSGKIPEKYSTSINEVLKLRPRDVSAESSSSANKVNCFEELQNIVQKMNFGNHALILNEILALRIPESDVNSRKIANILIAKTRHRFDLIPATSEILMQLPKKSSPQMNEESFSTQVKLSLLSQYINICNGNTTKDQTLQFINFTYELHAKQVIDLDSVKQIAELIAESASMTSKTQVPLVMLLMYIKVFRNHLLLQGVTMIKTVNTLGNSLQVGPKWLHDPIKNALQILSIDSKSAQDFEVPTLPQLSPVTEAASTTSATLPSRQASVEEPCKYRSVLKDDNLLNDIDALQKIVEHLNIQSVDDMNKFALSFYRTVMKSKDFTTYVRLAQLIESEISSRNIECQASFKESLCKLIQAPHGFDQMNDPSLGRDRAECSVRFAGELYKAGWLSRDCLKVTMDALAVKNFETKHQIELFHSLMTIVSLSLVKNGDGEMCLKYRNILQSRLETFESKSYLLCLDVLDTLNNILSFEKEVKPKSSNQKTVESILSKVNSNNLAAQARQLSAVPLKNAEDLDQLVHLLTIKALQNPNEASCLAKLAVEIQDHSFVSSDGKVTTAKDVLIEKCQEILLNNIINETKIHQMDEMLGFLQFICELFICNVFNSDFINMCLDLISEDESDNAVDCIFMMLVKVGAKVDAVMLEPYFKSFEAFGEKEDSYRSSVYKSLIELRNNNWEQKEIGASAEIQNELSSPSADVFESSFDKILSYLSEDKMEYFTNASIQFIRKSEQNQRNFIQLVMRCMLAESGRESVYAELCNQVRLKNKQDPLFPRQMLEYLRSRVPIFTCLTKEEFTDAVKLRLATLMIFVGELYQRDFIDDETLEVLMKPAKHLPFNNISKLVSIIAPKINGGVNVRLMALLLMFDEIAYERSSDFWKDLKEEVKEIDKIVSGLHQDASEL